MKSYCHPLSPTPTQVDDVRTFLLPKQMPSHEFPRPSLEEGPSMHLVGQGYNCVFQAHGNRL